MDRYVFKQSLKRDTGAQAIPQNYNFMMIGPKERTLIKPAINERGNIPT